jgi:uncharacterized protein YggU (UPF0235/DUF167 family)
VSLKIFLAQIGEVSLSKILDYLIDRKLKLHTFESTENELKLEFDLRAKPGSKFEQIVIDPETNQMVIKTKQRPIEGAANNDIVEKVSAFFHVAKNSVAIIKGEKSRTKRIQVKLVFSKQKTEVYFLDKIISTLKD